MASAQQPEVNLECPVCHDDFDKPKFLPCAHVVCRTCVISWLSASSQGGCPLCRIPIVTSGHGDISSLVDNLPTDLATSALIESKKALSGNHVCSVCDHTPAMSYCHECSIKLCKSCTTSHGRFPAFREHVLEDLNMLTAEHLAARLRSPCDNHSDRLAELYCPQHQTLICLLCSSSIHRTCSNVKTVGDMAKEARVSFTEQAQRLRNREAALSAQIKCIDEEIQQTQAQFNARQANVAATCNNLQQMIEVRQQEVNRVLAEEKENILAPKREKKILLEQQKTSVQAHAGSVERLLVPSPDSALLGMLDKLKARLDDLEAPMATEGMVAQPVKSTSHEALGQLEQAIAASLGQLTGAVSPATAREVTIMPVYHSSICREMRIWQDAGILCYDSSWPSIPVAQFVGQSPLNRMCNRFSFEIINEGNSCFISIGLCFRGYPADRQPGWEPTSIAYHADDGGIYIGAGSPALKRNLARRGDVMSVELDFSQLKASFFCNGSLVYCTDKLRMPSGGFYPAVGMHSTGEVVRLLEKDPWRAFSLSVYNHLYCREVRAWPEAGILSYDSKHRSVPVGQFVGPRPLCSECNRFSFAIINEGQSCCIAIGLCHRHYRPNRQPGWDKGSIGYHADDGGIFLENCHWSMMRKRAGRGDIMSVELNFDNQKATFRHNDDMVFETDRLEIPAGGFYPIVGMHSPGEVVYLLEKEPWQS